MSNFKRITEMTIANLKEDNRRLKAQIDSGHFQPGYVKNCQNYIAANYRQIKKLEKNMRDKS